MSMRVPSQEAPEMDAVQLELMQQRRKVRELRETLAEERLQRSFGDLLPEDEPQDRRGAA